MQFNYQKNETPLALDEMCDLIPKHINTQEELNAWEQRNIQQAELWVRNYKRDLLNVSFIRLLHKHMFNKTWKWAGIFRRSEKNIGINSNLIPTELKKLRDDITFYIEHKTFKIDEIAIRFHHRLVYIHPFPNGNGRHARLLADLLIVRLGKNRFTWGSNQKLTYISAIRSQYIDALQLADKGDYSSLIQFARS